MLDTYASIEAQIAGLADDIAYNSHDLDDGLMAGLFTLHDLESVSWVAAVMEKKRKEYPQIEDKILAQETIRDVMGAYVLDVLEETNKRLTALKPEMPDDIRLAKTATVAMSDIMKKRDRELRGFLWEHFYRHPQVSRVRQTSFRVVQDLFETFITQDRCLPVEWRVQAEETPKGWSEKNWRARTIADYIASMTDRLALLEHKDLFDPYQAIR